MPFIKQFDTVRIIESICCLEKTDVVVLQISLCLILIPSKAASHLLQYTYDVHTCQKNGTDCFFEEARSGRDTKANCRYFCSCESLSFPHAPTAFYNCLKTKNEKYDHFSIS